MISDASYQDWVEVLRNLGFKVRDGSRGGHKVITRSGLAEFTTDGFDCGHGRHHLMNESMELGWSDSRAYTGKVIK